MSSTMDHKWRLLAAGIAVIIGLFGQNAVASPSNSWFNDDNVTEGIISEDDSNFIQSVIAGIITFVIVVVLVCLILCFCCPICVIYKMRQRRGVVIRTQPQGQTVTINVNRTAPVAVSPPNPQVVAIPNNLNARNKPYPVQESVTVVPLLQPQPMQYPPSHPQPMNIGYPPGPGGPSYPPQNFELPPPYPGLPREADTSNLPYNPYFTGDNNANPSSPPQK